MQSQHEFTLAEIIHIPSARERCKGGGGERSPFANTCEGGSVDLFSNGRDLAVGHLNEYNLMSFIKATPHSFN